MTEAGDHELGTGEQATAGVVVPADHLCARCGYLSGASGSVVCPECGHAATAEEVRASEVRREVVRVWEAGRGLRCQQFWVWAGWATAFGIGAVSREAPVAIGAMLLLIIVLPPSVWFGSLELFSRDAERRAYMKCVWQRQVWMLHLPWLVWPGLVVVAVFVGLVERWAGGDGSGAYSTMVVVGFWGWSVGCVLTFGAWWKKRLHALAAGGYWRLGLDDAWAFGAGVVVVLVASFLGFLGGTAVAMGVAEWLGLGEFVWG